MSIITPSFVCNLCAETFPISFFDTLPNTMHRVQFTCPRCKHPNRPSTLMSLIVPIAGIFLTGAAVIGLISLKLGLHKYVFFAIGLVIFIVIFRLLFGFYSFLPEARGK